jgi:zinc finger protein
VRLLPSAEGVIYTARILSRQDLNRQIVKSETCTVTIPEYELTIPASKGQLTTVEGVIQDVIRDLGYDQPLRRIQDEDTFTKIQALIDKLKVIMPDEDEDEGVAPGGAANSEAPPMPPFTLKLDDPTGNSFIEFVDSTADPKWNLRTYRRTKEQNVALGLVADDSVIDEDPSESAPTADSVDNEEIYIFPGVCSSCGHPLNTMMKKVVIPYFKVRFSMIAYLVSHPSGRISSSCRPTAIAVVTGTTR